MAEKTIKTRILHKHAAEADWNKATNFVPKNGELIIYDTDANHNYKRLKIGDGSTPVTTLGFVDDNVRSLINELTNDFESFNESINNSLDDLQEQIDQNDIQISATQPAFSCTWFKVTSGN